jgi:hypothetical protein
VQGAPSIIPRKAWARWLPAAVVRRRCCGHRLRKWRGGAGQDGHAVGGLQRGAGERAAAVPAEPSDRQERASGHDDEGGVAPRRRDSRQWRHGEAHRAPAARIRRQGSPETQVELATDAQAAQEAVSRQENKEPKNCADLIVRDGIPCSMESMANEDELHKYSRVLLIIRKRLYIFVSACFFDVSFTRPKKTRV